MKGYEKKYNRKKSQQYYTKISDYFQKPGNDSWENKKMLA